jgi:hypothetical protein
MVLSHSSEATNCAAAQELPSFLWNSQVNYRVYNISALVPILLQINLVHTTPSCLFKIHFNIVYPPTALSS